MNKMILMAFVKMQTLKAQLVDEQGQDLIEYALVVALIAFAAVAGMNTVATKINAAFVAFIRNSNSISMPPATTASSRCRLGTRRQSRRYRWRRSAAR